VWLACKQLKAVAASPTIASFALVTCVFNPYFFGLSLFVFTDMLATFFCVLWLEGHRRQSATIVALSIAGGVLTRQYLAFLAVATALYCSAFVASRREALRLVMASVCGVAALLPLVYLWGGSLSPSNSLRDVYTTEGIRFDPHALSLYLAVPGAYLLPLCAGYMNRFSVTRAGAVTGAVRRPGHSCFQCKLRSYSFVKA